MIERKGDDTEANVGAGRTEVVQIGPLSDDVEIARLQVMIGLHAQRQVEFLNGISPDAREMMSRLGDCLRRSEDGNSNIRLFPYRRSALVACSSGVREAIGACARREEPAEFMEDRGF